MAHQSLAAHHSLDFHIVLQAHLNRYIEDVYRLYEQHVLLSPCAYEYPESTPGACDGQPCGSKATVHELGSGQDFCAKHFGEVTR